MYTHNSTLEDMEKQMKHLSKRERDSVLSFCRILGAKSETEFPDWYGIPGIKFIFRNSQSDPLIRYMGRMCPTPDVEDAMIEMFYEDGNEDLNDFPGYMYDHQSAVFELCENMVFENAA